MANWAIAAVFPISKLTGKEAGLASHESSQRFFAIKCTAHVIFLNLVTCCVKFVRETESVRGLIGIDSGRRIWISLFMSKHRLRL